MPLVLTLTTLVLLQKWQLTPSLNNPVTVHNIDVHDRLLLHLINQVLILKVNKSNNPTAIEIFTCGVYITLFI